MYPANGFFGFSSRPSIFLKTVVISLMIRNKQSYVDENIIWFKGSAQRLLRCEYRSQRQTCRQPIMIHSLLCTRDPLHLSAHSQPTSERDGNHDDEVNQVWESWVLFPA